MSNNNIFFELPASNRGQKGEATGSIKGTVKNLATQITHQFKDPWIWRDTQQGTLRFHGVVDDPEAQDGLVAIGLQLSSASQQNAEFNVGDKEILHLSYGPPDRIFAAQSGRVTIQRQPQDRINGLLKFQTVTKAGVQYDVDVVYDIGAP